MSYLAGMLHFRLRKALIRLFIHLFLWTLFLLLEYIIYYYTRFGGIYLRVLLSELPYTALIFIAPFYYNMYYLVPRLFLTRRYIQYFTQVAGMFVLLALAVEGVAGLYMKAGITFDSALVFEGDFITSFPPTLLSSVFLILTTLAISSCISFYIYSLRNERIKEQLQNETLSTELLFLKSQINPHFLFNTLNNLYSLNYRRSEKAPEAILKLKELMHYMFYESAREKVLLEQEVKYLHDFIDLQKLRLSREIPIDFRITGSTSGIRISPMLLIPFVENVFKHGDLQGENSYINIQLRIDSRWLYFEVQNLYRQNMYKDAGQGIGIQNLRRRLDLIYPGAHYLQTIAVDHTYKGILKLHIAQ
jgi:two-component system, LytTR family, sensor kinase